jgi:hypothetical protein
MQTSSPYQEEPQDISIAEMTFVESMEVENDFPTPKAPCKSGNARHMLEDRRYNLAADLW